MADTLTATLQTNQGRIVVRLFPDHAPKTVRNFVELAEGGRQWTDPRTGRATTSKLYDGTIFHRVIPDFMIQGGDPLGSGRGGPGYKFADEIHPDLRFDRPYLLAMANAGPGTNGSQFFITVAPTPWLNGKHTIFGEVIEGADVVDADQPAEDRQPGPAGGGRDHRVGHRGPHRQLIGPQAVSTPSDPGSGAPGQWDRPGQPDQGEQAPEVPTCYRHPGRETYVSCVRCGRHACPDCMRSAVGRPAVRGLRRPGRDGHPAGQDRVRRPSGRRRRRHLDAGRDQRRGLPGHLGPPGHRQQPGDARVRLVRGTAARCTASPRASGTG